ncbi:MAG: XcyI family restriction endonuclease [Planctomycetota bacterium]|jgi:hypothetical protein
MINNEFNIPTPALQIDFALALAEIREQLLQDALRKTVEEMEIPLIDQQLALYVSAEDLGSLAGRGLQGELRFPVPCVLENNPRLLAYYRLLLGFSQKIFYSSDFGITAFKSMEEKGILTARTRDRLPDLCSELCRSSSSLLNGIGIDSVTRELLDDLTLLTLGPQLRGGANVRKGTTGIITVFKVINEIVMPRIIKKESNLIEIRNSAGRTVRIEFAQDPDIVIREEMASDSLRNIIAIEVKGGTDFSNIHNRIGEAEKSHQKARQSGFVECWTVVNVDRIDFTRAHQESPSTNRFYRLSDLASGQGNDFNDFKNRVISLTGIPSI